MPWQDTSDQGLVGHGEPGFPRRMHNRSLIVLAAALLVGVGAPGCTADRAQVPTAEISAADAHIATELSRHLPATVTVEDRMGAAGFARLPEPLELGTGARLLEHQPGDVAYWPAGQSIIVFHHTGGGAPDGEELIAVGTVSAGYAALADCVSDCPIRLTVAGADDEGAGA